MEGGESGEVDLERLGVHLGEGNDGADHPHVPLRRVGILSADLEMIRSKPDVLVEDGKLVDGPVGTRSERNGAVRIEATDSQSLSASLTLAGRAN